MPDRLVGDAGHVRQVLINLAGNAIKFTDEGTVRWRLALATPTTAVRLRFSVIDTGIGIPSGRRARDCSSLRAGRRQPVAPLRRHGPGTTIAKGLTETMGGSIGFEFEHGGRAASGGVAVRAA